LAGVTGAGAGAVSTATALAPLPGGTPVPGFEAVTGGVVCGGNAVGGELPLAGEGLPPWVLCGVRAEALLRAGLLPATCMAFEKLEFESTLGSNWLISWLG
jgi:hypothetical protein